MISEVRERIRPSYAVACLVEVAVQECPGACGPHWTEPLFAFWSEEAIGSVLCSSKQLECYSYYFTKDLVGYQGPSGIARWGKVKAYSTMFRLLTSGGQKGSISYRKIAYRLSQAFPHGLEMIEEVASFCEKALGIEVEKLTSRLQCPEGSASLRFEATIDFRDASSHIGLMLSQFDRIELNDIILFDCKLVQRFSTQQLGLVIIPLDGKLLKVPMSLQQKDLIKVENAICTIAILESLATRCF